VCEFFVFVGMIPSCNLTADQEYFLAGKDPQPCTQGSSKKMLLKVQENDVFKVFGQV